jgi:PAS domain S-box-containing protein
VLAASSSEVRYRTRSSSSSLSIYVNPRFVEILSYLEVDELQGKNPLTLVADKDYKQVKQLLLKLSIKEISSVRYICSMLHKNGGLVDVGMHGSIVNYEGKSAIIGLMQDISDKKIA